MFCYIFPKRDWSGDEKFQDFQLFSTCTKKKSYFLSQWNSFPSLDRNKKCFVCLATEKILIRNKKTFKICFQDTEDDLKQFYGESKKSEKEIHQESSFVSLVWKEIFDIWRLICLTDFIIEFS